MVKYITTQVMPLYFEVRETRKVVATEEACNIALDYGDGQLHLPELPQNFPKPGNHPNLISSTHIFLYNAVILFYFVRKLANILFLFCLCSSTSVAIQ